MDWIGNPIRRWQSNNPPWWIFNPNPIKKRIGFLDFFKSTMQSYQPLRFGIRSVYCDRNFFFWMSTKDSSQPDGSPCISNEQGKILWLDSGYLTLISRSERECATSLMTVSACFMRLSREMTRLFLSKSGVTLSWKESHVNLRNGIRKISDILKSSVTVTLWALDRYQEQSRAATC